MGNPAGVRFKKRLKRRKKYEERILAKLEAKAKETAETKK